jgi:hypothetical protein
MRRLPADRYATSDELLHDLRKLQSQDAVAPAAVLRSSASLWWWQFHQGVLALLVAITPVLSWLVRGWLGRPAGTWMFFVILALATASVTLRLNLLFTSRVHPSTVAIHRQQMFPWIASAEAILAMLLLGTAADISYEHEATAALLICLAIILAASLAVIEPATTRSAGLIGAPEGAERA